MFLARRGAAPALLLTAALLAGCASAGAPGTDEAPAPTPGAPAEAVDALSYVARSPESWSFDLHWTAVARFAESSYGEFFPDGVIVGLSTEGPVVALSGADGLIDTIFMAAGPELLDG